MGDAIVRTLVRLLDAPQPAAMGHGGAGGGPARGLACMALLSPDGRRGRSRLLALASSPGRRTGPGRWRRRSRRLDRLAGGRVLGQPARRRRPAALPISARDAQALRLTARRTWRFFETFVTAADNMLPPDNFQEDPAPGAGASDLADQHRPLSAVGGDAHDFGWAGRPTRSERLEATLATMARAAALPRPFLQLVRHARPAAAGPPLRVHRRQRQSGRAPPRARQCLRGWRRSAGPRRAVGVAGLADAVALAREEAGRLRDQRRTQAVTWRQLDDALAALAADAARGAGLRRLGGASRR